MLLTCWYSQTGLLWDLTNMPFYTITNLQGSQTVSSYMTSYYSFTPLQTYKVLKPELTYQALYYRFTPLQTYKVLKRLNGRRREGCCFTPLQTYKVLKR